jgi:hypothetical protein
MMLRRLLLALALVVLAFTSEATAGGWWSGVELDRSTVAAGQRVKARATVLFSSIDAAEQARKKGRFYVYLVQGLDYSIVERAMGKPFRSGWWSPGDAEVVQVAPVAVAVRDGNIGRAHASFRVPELAPGTYAVMLCDSGCVRPLADVVPTAGFTIVTDPATARLAGRVDRLEELLMSRGHRLAAARAAAERARVQVQGLGSELERLRAKTSALAQRMRAGAESGSSPLLPLAGWLVAAALASVLVTLLARRRRRREPLPGWNAEDEKLLASELAGERRARAPLR